MKIAVPVNQHEAMSLHFGRSHAFLVLEVEGGTIVRRDTRINDQTGIGHDPAQGHAHLHGHDHTRFVSLLGDCEAVVSLGMGSGARHALEAAGLTVRLLETGCSPDEAALRFESGSLDATKGTCCGGRAGHGPH